jgi:hypothetical protein
MGGIAILGRTVDSRTIVKTIRWIGTHAAPKVAPSYWGGRSVITIFPSPLKFSVHEGESPVQALKARTRCLAQLLSPSEKYLLASTSQNDQGNSASPQPKSRVTEKNWELPSEGLFG